MSPESAKPIVVIDLDGTLCNADHRIHHAQAGEWDEFNSACIHDTPYEDALALITSLDHKKCEMVFCTGRGEQWKKQTIDWLCRYGIYHLATDIIMRPTGDYSSDYLIKPRVFEEWYEKNSPLAQTTKPQKAVAFILEDRARVVEAWRELGYNCWQIRQGAY